MVPVVQAAPLEVDAASPGFLRLDPGIANGTRLQAVLSGQAPASGPVTLVNAGAVAKSCPASAPVADADLTFTALTPCRILDSRPAYSGTGTWLAASTNTINVGPVANYTAQGGLGHRLRAQCADRGGQHRGGDGLGEAETLQFVGYWRRFCD